MRKVGLNNRPETSFLIEILFDRLPPSLGGGTGTLSRRRDPVLQSHKWSARNRRIGHLWSSVHHSLCELVALVLVEGSVRMEAERIVLGHRHVGDIEEDNVVKRVARHC
jgi:hypothetical protein